jgi:hypothetical protein
VVVEERRRVVMHVETQVAPLGPETTPDSWIEIVLRDPAGNPVPDEPYRIDLPDGRIRSGTTNAAGKAREEGIEPGTCVVRFPRLDAAVWEAA